MTALELLWRWRDPADLAAHVAMWRTVWASHAASGSAEVLMAPEYGPGYFTGPSYYRTEWSMEQLWKQTCLAADHIRAEFDAWQLGQPPTGKGPTPA